MKEARLNDPAIFWSWFQQNEGRFHDLEVPEKEELLDEVLEHLQAYSERLWFEIGGPEDARELIISAEGALEAFHEVRRLVGAAPRMSGWTVLAFKPAHGFDFVTDYGARKFAPEATWYLPMELKDEPHALGLRVAYAHYEPANEQVFLAATRLMLEAGLGELVAAERIRHVEVGFLPSSPKHAGYMPLTALPDYLAYLDRRVTQGS